MKLLLLEPQPAITSVIATKLIDAGHQLERCYDEIDGAPCRGVRDDARCPLHQPVQLAVVVRETGMPDLLFETGAVCAERHRVPVIRVQPDQAGEVAALVQHAAASGQDRLEARYAAVVRVALADERVAVEARRDAHGVRASVRLATQGDQRHRTMIAERARTALRAFDPFVRCIDVAVEHDTDATVATDDRHPRRNRDEWFVDDGDDL
ncbi:MAG: hypothetical protein ABIR68_02830 [Ilumatobacteraceae bacterium]